MPPLPPVEGLVGNPEMPAGARYITRTVASSVSGALRTRPFPVSSTSMWTPPLQFWGPEEWRRVTRTHAEDFGV